MDNSASHTRGVPHIGGPRYELTTPTPATWVQFFGRRLSLWEEQQLLLPQHRTSSQRHQQCWLIVPISLEKPMFRTTLQCNFQGQSSPSICLVHLHRLLGLLEYCGKSLTVWPAAHCSTSRELFTPAHFDCVVPSLHTLGSVLDTLSLAPFPFLIRLHIHDVTIHLHTDIRHSALKKHNGIWLEHLCWGM